MEQLNLITVYDTQRISDVIFRISKDIHHDYKTLRPVFLVVLKGGMFFATEVMKHFPQDFAYQLELVQTSSYGDGTLSSGKVDVKFLGKETSWADDKDVLIIDDVADTMHTIMALKNHPKLGYARSVRSMVLIEKPARREYFERPNYFGIQHEENDFLVGCGMGYDDMYRHLPYISKLTIGEKESE